MGFRVLAWLMALGFGRLGFKGAKCRVEGSCGPDTQLVYIYIYGELSKLWSLFGSLL